MNFMKKIVDGQVEEDVHFQFTRFGKGEYKGRFLLNLWKTKKIKAKSSFEFANDLVSICANFGGGKSSGIVMSKKDISDMMKEKGIEGISESKKDGLYYKNNIPSQELSKDQLDSLIENSYFALLDIEGKDFKLKMKMKLPKPGKGEGKVDDKFCQLEAEEKYYKQIKEDLFWDMPDAKKSSIKHTVIVDSLIMPEGEEDYAKIRELAKRKGKIIRIAELDGKEIKKEIDFTA